MREDHGNTTETEPPTRPYEQCPRFARYSVNHFLSDPDQDKRVDLPNEPRCGLGKARRMPVATPYPDLLPNRGVKPRELASSLAWESDTPAEQRALREQSRRALGRAKECSVPT